MTKLKAKIVRTSDKKIIAQNCLVTQTACERLVGLLGHKTLNEDQALLIDPCNSIHTFFMKFDIDVLFLDAENKIIKQASYSPWRVSSIKYKAKKVLELPAGSLKKHELKIGQQIEVHQ